MAKRKFKFGDRVHTHKYPKATVAFNLESGAVGIVPESWDHATLVLTKCVKPGWLKKARGEEMKKLTSGKPLITTKSGFKVYKPSKKLNAELDKAIRKIKSRKVKYKTLDLEGKK